MSIPRLSPGDAKQLVDEQGYVYVDVRSEPEYAAGHPVGAINVPLLHAAPGGMTPNADFVAVVSALFAKDARLVLGCKAGGRSLRAAEQLVAVGFTGIVDQRAGFDGVRDAFGGVVEPGWVEAGLPVEAVTAGGAYRGLRTKVGT